MQSKENEGDTPYQKPEGGYVQVSAYAIGLLWWSLSEGLISSHAVRVGLALYEARIRRAAHAWTERKAGRGAVELAPHYSAEELAHLCGLPEKRTRSALRELRALGLLAEFSPSTIRFARSFTELTLTEEQRSAFRSWLKTLTKRKRVPVPRRVLVLACESSSRALIAVVLGVCLRCSWLRPGEGFSFTGRVSCSWLSSRFRLSIRAVQGAKEHLVSLGFIHRTGNISRFGEVVAINPAWHRLLGTTPEAVPINGDEGRTPSTGTNSAGVSGASGTISAPPSLIPEKSSPREIQIPRRESPGDGAPGRPGPGIFNSDPQEKSKNQDLPPPRLSAIRPEDFQDVGRALELYRQAVKCGLMRPSDHSRLLWMAAIERSRTVPVRNPAGVFLHVVKRRKWDYLSDGHYDAANARLKAFLHAPAPNATPFLVPRLGAAERPPERATPKPKPQLSKDAQLVELLTQKLGGRGPVFAALHRHAGWARERYAATVAELENSQPVAANAV